MKNIKFAVILTVLILALGACVPAPLIIGGASGGAVYSTTNDHIKDTFNISREQAFEVMIGILTSEDGKIEESSIADGKIKAKLRKSTVYITIKPVNERATEVAIRAKKHIELIPDKETSVRLYRVFVKEVMK